MVTTWHVICPKGNGYGGITATSLRSLYFEEGLIAHDIGDEASRDAMVVAALDEIGIVQ